VAAAAGAAAVCTGAGVSSADVGSGTATTVTVVSAVTVVRAVTVSVAVTVVVGAGSGAAVEREPPPNIMPPTTNPSRPTPTNLAHGLEVNPARGEDGAAAGGGVSWPGRNELVHCSPSQKRSRPSGWGCQPG